MKTILRNYGVLAISLIALFASGVSIGRLSLSRVPAAVAPTSDIGMDPESWVATASRGLVRDLELDNGQERKVREQLEPVAAALFSDQERTLFQMHLRLLMLHDTLAKEGSLDQAQLGRLAISRSKLKSLIVQKFPRMVRANPTLAIETEKP
jgi:hypothetical protein